MTDEAERKLAALLRGNAKRYPEGPDLELIGQFARVRDRRYPPVFVGREKELGVVQDNCTDALGYCRAGKQAGGHIIVFRGAPGAGKSSLLEHIAVRVTGKSDPLVIRVPLLTLENPEELVREIAGHVLAANSKELEQKKTTTDTVTYGVGKVAGGEHSVTRETGPLPAKFQVLSKLRPGKTWNRAVCLLVDEAQQVTEKHGASLQELHLGEHGLPIVTVCGGLANTVENLRKALSPRLTHGNIITLGGLMSGEVRSCVAQMFDRCRVGHDDRQVEEIASEIAERSEGWPQHVRTETAALFAGLEKTRGDLNAVNIRAVNRQAREWREESYAARKSKEIDDSIFLVGALLRKIPPDGCEVMDAREILRKNADADKEGWELPDGMKPKHFLDHLFRQGILQPHGENSLICPIPSLQTWFIESATRSGERSGAAVADANRNALEAAVKPAAEIGENPAPAEGAGEERQGCER